MIAWTETRDDNWRISIYDRNGTPKTHNAPRVAKQVYPQGETDGR
jgi:hypothetical protein